MDRKKQGHQSSSGSTVPVLERKYSFDENGQTAQTTAAKT
jgi:hypothetical protein